MSWDSYTPLSTTNTIKTPHLQLRSGDSIFLPDTTTPTDDYENTTKYHIVSIDAETKTATLWNYAESNFEILPIQTIQNWRENNAPVEPALTIINLTANGSPKTLTEKIKTTIQVEEPAPVGIKIHGSLTQTPMTIDALGPTEFGCLLQVALKSGTTGAEITEPWYADVSISAPTLESFIEKVYTELGTKLVEQTALDESAAEELIEIVLRDYEAKAHARVGMEHTVLFDDTEALQAYIDSQMNQDTADFSVILHERANNNIIQHFNTE